MFPTSWYLIKCKIKYTFHLILKVDNEFFSFYEQGISYQPDFNSSLIYNSHITSATFTVFSFSLNNKKRRTVGVDLTSQLPYLYFHFYFFWCCYFFHTIEMTGKLLWRPKLYQKYTVEKNIQLKIENLPSEHQCLPFYSRIFVILVWTHHV